MAIIKCPECGREISENAPFCPSCGIKIAQNIKRCPECGTISLLNNDLCPHCGYPFKQASDTPNEKEHTAIHDNSAYNPNSEEPKQDIKSKKKWIIGIVAAVIIIIIGGTIIYMQSSWQAQDEEEMAYQNLTNDTNISDYEDFLTNYPDSKYKTDVQNRMNTLKAQNDKWLSICLSGSKNDFIQFMNEFPSSPYELQCKTKIDSLDWMDAKRLNTPDAIQRYLEEHPDGKYIVEAQKMQTTINDKKVEPQEEDFIHSTMVQFFTALGTNDKTAACANISPIMTNFLQKKDAKKADVIAAMDQMHPESITSMQFIVNSDFVINKTKVTNGYNYSVKFSVDQNIVRTDEGKTFASYTVSAELTPQFKISALKMTEISNR